MKKRFLTVILPAIMIISLSACAGSKDTDVENKEQEGDAASGDLKKTDNTDNEESGNPDKETSEDESPSDEGAGGGEEAGEVVSAEDTSVSVEEDTEKTADAETMESTEDDSPEADGNTTGDENAQSSEYLSIYNEVLQKLVNGEEYFAGDGEAYDYSFATSPAYALYDIDKNGIDELFITGEIDHEFYAYSVYYIKDGAAEYGRAINGYIPEDDQWIYGFDFLTSAYSFDPENGFSKVWEIEYPYEEGENSLITYEGEEAREITDSEINEILSKDIREPEGLSWTGFDATTDLTASYNQ